MSTHDSLAPIAAKLTLNAAINLRNSAANPCPSNPESVHGTGCIYTGPGKWTHIAAIGVENSLIRLGLAERRPPHDWAYITPLGREVAAYVKEHWNALEFRIPKQRRSRLAFQQGSRRQALTRTPANR